MRPSDLIGNTPLVKLESFSTDNVEIYAKLEMYNLGGSVKDRLAHHIITTAINNGSLHKGDTIVEATAGNTGIGLGLVANQYDINCVIFAPEGFSQEKIDIMTALGAEVKRTPKADGMLGARKAAETYAETHSAYYINQFETTENPKAYQHTLAAEIIAELPDVTHFVAGAGSGGTFTGVSTILQPKGIKNIVVEPQGSILSGNPAGKHDTEGIGVEVWPTFLDKTLIDDIKVVSDKDAFQNVKQLANQEGLLVGSSSGAALQAAIETAENIDQGKIVVVFPDGSDRYMSKSIFNY